jgi:glucose/arabinose dehydrogenase
LLGVAVHPSFAINHQVYLYFTTEKNGVLTNQVDRYELSDQKLTNKKMIIDNIPAAPTHDGGGIAFGPDDKLYITTGDARQADQAQDTGSLAGKILRLNDDGSVPSDNPFQNAVWSYGHRNPQGITWDDQGRMWAVEHGPSGERNGTGKDELNRIEKGANYGWPVSSGDEKHEGMKTPIVQSGAKETWAPSGIAYANGSLFFAGLRGQSLYEARITGDNSVELTRHFVEEYGRLRAVAVNGSYLYTSTSNRDGRGEPATSDDTILQIDLRSAWREE